jgi:hypothetical protein
MEKKTFENVRRIFNHRYVLTAIKKRGFTLTPTTKVVNSKLTHRFLVSHFEKIILS